MVFLDASSAQICGKTTGAVGPANGQHAKAADKAPGAVIVDPAKQFNLFGSGAIVGAVVDDQHRFSLLTRKAVEYGKQPCGQYQHQFAPIVGRCFHYLVGGILAESEFVVDGDATEEISTDERQRENRLYQRANAVTVAFTNAASVKKGADTELGKKLVNLTLNANVGLSLGGNFAMVHLSPFLLNLL